MSGRGARREERRGEEGKSGEQRCTLHGQTAMADDVPIRLRPRFAVRETTTKRDHADDALTSSPVKGDERRHEDHRRDSFQRSADDDEQEQDSALEAHDPPQECQPPEQADEEETGGLLDVQA